MDIKVIFYLYRTIELYGEIVFLYMPIYFYDILPGRQQQRRYNSNSYTYSIGTTNNIVHFF